MSADTSLESGVYLGDVPFFADADPGHLRRYSSNASRTTYEPGNLILDFDDATHDVFFITSGKVRAVIRTPGGREIILGDIQAGGIFGDMSAIDLAPRSASVIALDRSTLWRMNGRAFVDCVIQAPLIAERLLRVLTERIRLGNARLVEHSALTGRHRLYAELLRESRPLAPGSSELSISPPPLQHILAGRIGIRREAVSREMAALMRRGIISRTAQALVIHQAEKLKSAVERELDA